MELFGKFGNGNHHLQSLDGIFPACRFAGEHDGIGPVVDGVGHIGDFGPGRTGISDHRVKHLRGRDNKLSLIITFLDHVFLETGKHFRIHFDPQISAGNHDTVSGNNDFMEVFYPFLGFDFGNDFDF